MKNMHRRTKKGFTIIEIGMVLIVAGGFLVFALTAAQKVAESSKYSLTREKIEVINRAILSYIEKNNDLPCPASSTALPSAASFGKEVLTPASGHCQTGNFAALGVRRATGRDPDGAAGPMTGMIRIGAVPVHALNLPDDFMFDEWGRRFSYAVSANQTNGVLHPDSGVIDVRDSNNRSVTRTPESGLYLIISHGRDGKGGYRRNGVPLPCGAVSNALDAQNCESPPNSIFITGRHSIAENTGYFDDVIKYAALLPAGLNNSCDSKLAFNDPDNTSGLDLIDGVADGCVSSARNIVKWETSLMGCSGNGYGSPTAIAHPTLGPNKRCSSANFSGSAAYSSNYSGGVEIFNKNFTASVTGRVRIEAVIPIRYQVSAPDISLTPNTDACVRHFYRLGNFGDPLNPLHFAPPWRYQQHWGRTLLAVVRFNGTIIGITDVIKPGTTNNYLGDGSPTIDGAVSSVFAFANTTKDVDYNVRINIVSAMPNECIFEGPSHTNTGGNTAWAGTMWDSKYLSLGSVDVIEMEN